MDCENESANSWEVVPRPVAWNLHPAYTLCNTTITSLSLPDKRVKTLFLGHDSHMARFMVATRTIPHEVTFINDLFHSTAGVGMRAMLPHECPGVCISPCVPCPTLIVSCVHKGLGDTDNLSARLMVQFAYNHGLWWKLSTRAEEIPKASNELVMALVQAGGVFDGKTFVKLNVSKYKTLVLNRFDLHVQVVVGDKVYAPLRRVQDMGFVVDAGGKLNFCIDTYDTNFCGFVQGPIVNQNNRKKKAIDACLKKVDAWRGDSEIIDTDAGSLDCSTVLVNLYA